MGMGGNGNVESHSRTSLLEMRLKDRRSGDVRSRDSVLRQDSLQTASESCDVLLEHRSKNVQIKIK